MPTWRDRWGGMPNVVVVAETPATEEGVIEDALLFVLDGGFETATIFDADKRAHAIALPPEAQEGSYMGVGLDIVLAAPNPEPHPKESP